MSNNHLYSNITTRLDTIVGGQTWWPRLFKARDEYLNMDHGYYEPTTDGFHAWLEDVYGIKMVLDPDGGITDIYDVVDEHKYMIFELKFI